MTNVETPIKKEHSNGSSIENQKRNENHEEAAKHHHEAAKHHESGNHEKACESTLKAHGHHCIASETQREISKHHALNN